MCINGPGKIANESENKRTCLASPQLPSPRGMPSDANSALGNKEVLFNIEANVSIKREGN